MREMRRLSVASSMRCIYPLPYPVAVGFIQTWLRFKVQEISGPIMTGALEIGGA